MTPIIRTSEGNKEVLYRLFNHMHIQPQIHPLRDELLSHRAIDLAELWNENSIIQCETQNKQVQFKSQGTKKITFK